VIWRRHHQSHRPHFPPRRLAAWPVLGMMAMEEAMEMPGAETVVDSATQAEEDCEESVDEMEVPMAGIVGEGGMVW